MSELTPEQRFHLTTIVEQSKAEGARTCDWFAFYEALPLLGIELGKHGTAAREYREIFHGDNLWTIVQRRG